MNVVFRADGDAAIGTGHMMRCLALAQAISKDGGRVTFVTATMTDALTDRLTHEGCAVQKLQASPYGSDDAHETAMIAKQESASWIVVDGYNFNDDYQRALKKENVFLLFIDDFGHCTHYEADVILNQNISADESWYENRNNAAKLLLGTSYVMLRREFQEHAQPERSPLPVAGHLLITLGGGDPDNATMKVLEAVSELQTNVKITAAIGGSNPHHAALKKYIADHQLPVKLLVNVEHMPELMTAADLAVSAGGSTCYELAYMSLPSLALTIAENQRAIAEKLHHEGVMESLGWHTDIGPHEIAVAIDTLARDQKRRTAMTQKGQKLVDGKGTLRIMEAMQRFL